MPRVMFKPDMIDTMATAGMVSPMVAKAEQLRTSNSSTGYQWYSDSVARVEGTYA